MTKFKCRRHQLTYPNVKLLDHPLHLTPAVCVCGGGICQEGSYELPLVTFLDFLKANPNARISALLTGFTCLSCPTEYPSEIRHDLNSSGESLPVLDLSKWLNDARNSLSCSWVMPLESLVKICNQKARFLTLFVYKLPRCTLAGFDLTTYFQQSPQTETIPLVHGTRGAAVAQEDR
jgi:hypothetical protein